MNLSSPREALSGDERLRRIIRHWDRAGLCSPAHSTCSGSPWLAKLDNYVESRLLSDMVAQVRGDMRGRAAALDIGAGYGRLSEVLARHFQVVHALEAAPQVHGKLQERMASRSNVHCYCACFEDFEVSPGMYDLAVVSGVLYLYDDQMVNGCLLRLSSVLAPGGYVVIRDFLVSAPPIRIPSTYVEGSACFYRDRRWWEERCSHFGFKLLRLRPSKAELFCLRASPVMRLLETFRLDTAPVPRMLALVAYLGASRARTFRPKPARIHTVYLLLQKT